VFKGTILTIIWNGRKPPTSIITGGTAACSIEGWDKYYVFGHYPKDYP
jgi:hypothetical protein